MGGRVQKVTRMGKTQYVVVLELGRDENGKRIAPWVSRHDKRSDALTDLANRLTEMQENGPVVASAVTVAEWCERWLRDYASLAVASTTLDHYTAVVRKHVIPELGDIRLQKLDKPTIQRAIIKWSNGYASSTTRQIMTVFKQILREAVSSGLLRRNPAQGVVLPRVQRKEPAALDEQETVELLRKLRDTKLYLPTLIAVTTGMRRGEILGLKWDAIEGNTVSVTETIASTGEIRPPKTELGRRCIVLPASVVTALADHKAEQEKEREAAGAIWKDTGYVFTRADGSPWSANEISCNFTRLTRRLGFKIRFHDLRHTHASQLLKAGVHVKVVASRLGHDPNETLRTYAHVLPGLDAEAAAIADSILSTGTDG